MLFKISQYSEEITCVGFFYNKVPGRHACNVIKKRPQRRCFAVNIAKCYEQLFLKNISGSYFSHITKYYIKILNNVLLAEAGLKRFSKHLRKQLLRGLFGVQLQVLWLLGYLKKNFKKWNKIKTIFTSLDSQIINLTKIVNFCKNIFLPLF